MSFGELMEYGTGTGTLNRRVEMGILMLTMQSANGHTVYSWISRSIPLRQNPSQQDNFLLGS